ncbi:MAG: hypothetical protein ACRDPW_06205 [Mycobacteriales bacterium]
MVPVGVLLLVLAVAFGAGFLVAPGDSADVEFYGLMLQDLSARNLVVVGSITGFIAALGAESIRWGTARWRRRRRIARKKERELDAERTHGEAQESAANDSGTSSAETTAQPQAATEPARGGTDTELDDDPTGDPTEEKGHRTAG